MNNSKVFKNFSSAFKKLWILFILFPAVMAALTFNIEKYLIKAQYTSNTQLLVTAPKSGQLGQASDNVRTALQMASTYSTTLKSARNLKKILKEKNYDISLNALSKNVDVKNNTNSLIFTVSVTDINANRAQKIAQDLARVNQKEFPKLFNNTKIVVLEEASKGMQPDKKILYILSILWGLMFAVIAIFIRMARQNIAVKKSDKTESLYDNHAN